MAQYSDSKPLSSVRILDLTRVLAGPLCTMILGDLGADVIKVERPGTGDDSRGWGPPFDDHGFSAYFLAVNRNKKSIALDLTVSADFQVLLALLAGADVVVDNFIPGTLERLGLNAREWLERRPELIWCTVTGFGPDSSRPGYDYVVQAEQGWMSINGAPGGPPLKTGVAYADLFAGKDAAISILAALAGRTRREPLTLEERRIFISLAHSASSALINVAQIAILTGVEARQHGNAHPNLVPYQLFATADAPIVLAVGNDSQWIAFLNAAGGLDDLLMDATLATNAGRVNARDRIVSRVEDRLRSAPAQHWMDVLSRAGVPCGRVRGVLESLQTMSVSPVTGIPPATPGSVRLAPPRLDEHGGEIRARGWSAF